MTDQPPGDCPAARRPRSAWDWIAPLAALAGLLVVGWACLTTWGAIVHGHPLYATLLLVTALASAVAFGRHRVRARRRRPRTWLRTVLLLIAVAWMALVVWLRPFQAVQPALDALRSDSEVTVAESATQIVLSPTGATSRTGLFFQPGARVEARSYAAILRPVAEAGHLVVIAKQPAGIAFLALPTFDAVKAEQQHQTRWVVGGHSLGGTVAAMHADSGDTDPSSPVVGLVLFASYPAGDLSASLDAAVLSVSGSRDGLADPAEILASRADLPPTTEHRVVDGANHAFFGDYGPQPGDGTPTITADEARADISSATVRFVTDRSR